LYLSHAEIGGIGSTAKDKVCYSSNIRYQPSRTKLTILIKEETKTAPVETPLMKQYYTIKAKYPDAMLLFRVGDFYETFGEDAIRASSVLGIVLTRRANGSASFIELAGFPHHSLDTYLPRLVRAGMRVAICDQLEDPKLTKKIVKRGVTELVSPGVSYNDKILDHKKNNFLGSIHGDGKNFGIAFIDISTGEFLVAEGNASYIDKLIQNFNPCEIIFSKTNKKDYTDLYASRFYCFSLDEWVYQEDYARETLLKHFGTISLKGFGVQDMPVAVIAAGAALHYVSDTRQEQLKHISGISRIEEDKYVWLDKFTIRNLEIVNPSNEKGVSLVDIIDHTLTPMGGRLLRRWLLLPLKDVTSIEERQEAVSYMLHHSDFPHALSTLLKQAGDIERMISKAALGKISPREVQQLRRSLEMVQQIRELCLQTDNPSIRTIADQLNTCSLIKDRIIRELHPDAPAMVNKGSVINEGFHAELDELRNIAFNGKDYLLRMQQREAERTGITSLKVGFNNVFGYYIEVTHTHKDKVPTEWTRKQTLTNAERYITEELKQYEEKILGAEEKILALEVRLFAELVQGIVEYVQPIQLNASLIARLDCLHSFADVAGKNEYVRPVVNDSRIIDIQNGRHPVIEKQLAQGEKFIANDIYLDPDAQQILMITGPNMSGKSALLRQTALITLLAQTGSFVPASSAQIGIVDRIFTRVGASDNISSGESTFMVEMNETASILHNVSARSLILLDEIGRGTATYDGISIAWAIAEYLHNHAAGRPKTLFATHYHELNEMEELMPRIRNYHVAVREVSNNVIFLRKLIPGGSEHSFGIHVAKMAGIPAKVVIRAQEMLKHLEASRSNPGTKGSTADDNLQLSFFQLDDPVLAQIKDEIVNTDIDNLTPLQALNKLQEIKKILGA
jgi:DNA mismatch repair protein MutS